MTYRIDYTEDAKRDLTYFRKFERKYILDEIDKNLQHEPTVETRNRKPLDANDIADWELRLGKFRVLYDVEEEVKIVAIQAIGFKIGSQLYVRNERVDL
jgi:mRNA-degrading endonuclease RelE of RelBE toxin-antitoxin system